MNIRPYEQKDWDAVCEIYDLAKPDELRGIVDSSLLLPLAADSKMNALFRASRIAVAVDDCQVVGFAGNRDSFLTWLFVHPSHRRRGIGNALVRHIVSGLRPPVTLNVAAANQDAGRLYERIGFTIEREFIGDFQGRPCQVCKLVLARACAPAYGKGP